MPHKISLSQDKDKPYIHYLFIDEILQSNATACEINVEAGNMPTIEVTYISDAIEFEGDAQVVAIINGKRYKLIE